MPTADMNAHAQRPDPLLTLAQAASLLRTEAARIQRAYGANGYHGHPTKKAWAAVYTNTAEALVTLAVLEQLNAHTAPWEIVGRVESALPGANGFHVRLADNAAMPQVGAKLYAAQVDALDLLRSLGPKPWETSPEAHAQARLIDDFAAAIKQGGA